MNTQQTTDWRVVSIPVGAVSRGDEVQLDGAPHRVISTSLLDCGGVELLINDAGTLRAVWFPIAARVSAIRH